jgi:5'-nucleotidase (lipoprotein e(P4) family)
MKLLASMGVMVMPVLVGGCLTTEAPSRAAARSTMQAKGAERDDAPPSATARVQIVPGATALPPPDGTAEAATARTTDTVPPGMQFLYGSGEAAAASVQAYQALTRYLLDVAAYGKRDGARQVVLADGASLDAPRFEPCGNKPKAVVLDIDETALLNLGYEADEAQRGTGYDAGRWSRWEQTGADKVVAVPGAKSALDRARAAGVTVIFNSNRSNLAARQTEAALDHAGLGPAKHGTTLWLKGDKGEGSGKDDRRAAIASSYCVVALVGDQLGDFSDLFNAGSLTPPARRALAGAPQIASLWGNGWFVLPNPVYGTALKGGAADVFPPDTRWIDPAEEK